MPLQPVPVETCLIANPGIPSPHSPTPSPASSIGSNSSGYSSGDRRTVGVSQCVAVPINLHTALQKQHHFYSNLIASFSYWEEADKLIFSGGNKGKQYKLIVSSYAFRCRLTLFGASTLFIVRSFLSWISAKHFTLQIRFISVCTIFRRKKWSVYSRPTRNCCKNTNNLTACLSAKNCSWLLESSEKVFVRTYLKMFALKKRRTEKGSS